MSQPLYFFQEFRDCRVKEQLEKLVLQMYKNGVRYSEAVREFQKAFLVTVLREHNANQVKAAKRLSMHRNTLRRHIAELEVDVETLRSSRRRPPLSERIVREKKKATAT
jgi:DNA-binding NtrC family response regulator